MSIMTTRYQDTSLQIFIEIQAGRNIFKPLPPLDLTKSVPLEDKTVAEDAQSLSENIPEVTHNVEECNKDVAKESSKEEWNEAVISNQGILQVTSYNVSEETKISNEVITDTLEAEVMAQNTEEFKEAAKDTQEVNLTPLVKESAENVKQQIEEACSSLCDVFGYDEDNKVTVMMGDVSSDDQVSEDVELCKTPTFVPSVDRIERIISHTLNQHRILKRSRTVPNFSSSLSPRRCRNSSNTQFGIHSDQSCDENEDSVFQNSLIRNPSIKSTPGNDFPESREITHKRRSLSTTAVQTSFDENKNLIDSPKKISESQSKLVSTGTNTTNSLERPMKRSSSTTRIQSAVETIIITNYKCPHPKSRNCSLHSHMSQKLTQNQKWNYPNPNQIPSNMIQNHVPNHVSNHVGSQNSQSHVTKDQRSHNHVTTGAVKQNSVVSDPITSPTKPTNFPQQFSQTMYNGHIVYDESPEMQVVVNSTSPVLLRRKPSNRQQGRARQELNMYANDSEYAMIDKTEEQSKFMKESMARTWHGVTRHKWKQVYAPIMHSMLTNMNSNSTIEENCNVMEANNQKCRSSQSQKTLLDAMHKKYCAYQYTNRLVIPYTENETLPFMFKSSPPPPDRMKSRSWLIKQYAIPVDAASSPASPDASPRLPGKDKSINSKNLCKSVEEPYSQSIIETKMVEGANNSPKAEAEDITKQTKETDSQRETTPAVSPGSSETNEQRLQPGKEDAEIEAVQACRWLKEAGFPQYAQMYEDGHFPVDIHSIEREHDFLDKDSLQPLVRRLNTLNKCSAMRISTPSKKTNEESDDEDQCALSDKWKYQHNIRRWSRKDLISPVSDEQRVKSSSSNDSLLTDQNSSSGDSPVLDTKVHHSQDDYFGIKTSTPVTTKEEMNTNFKSPTLKRAASERLKGAKSILKRMESLKSSRKRRIVKNGNAVEISGPVIVDNANMQEKIRHLNCKDLSPSSETRPEIPVDSERETAIIDREDLSPVSPVSIATSPGSSTTSPVVPEPWSDDTTNYTTPLSAKTKQSSSLQELSDIESILQSTTPNSDISHDDAVLGSSPRRQFSSRRNQSDTNLSTDSNSVEQLNRPGRFPKELSSSYIKVSTKTRPVSKQRAGSFNLGSDSSLYNGTNSSASPVVRRRRGSADPRLANHRASYYDNVPEEEDLQSTQRELDLILNKLFQDINGLNKAIYGEDAADLEPPQSLHNSADLSAGILDFEQDHRDITDDNPDDRTIDDVISGTMSSDSTSDHDIPGEYISHDDSTEHVVYRERRDSGVGSSLTRTPSDRRRYRIRWHSFQKSNHPSIGSRNIQITSLSVCQLMMLQKLSLCKLTGLIEKYSPNRSGWSWTVPRFMKRHKAPDYKEKNVFAVPLLVILQRTGQPLPQCMLHAMRFLRKSSKDAVGIFRKSGVRTRIQKLKNEVEANPEMINFDGLQAYDVADLLKQYFRDLPECLLTNKLSEIFINIFMYLPSEQRVEALQSSVLLLPDENREVLESLLLFLSDISSQSSEHQMTASNLAVCFAPSLFNMGGCKNNPNQSPSPRRARKNLGVPDTRELLEQKAAHECLTTLITECRKIFTISMNSLGRRFSYIEQGNPVTMEEYNIRSTDDTPGYKSDVDTCIQGLLKESREKFRGWVSLSSNSSVDVSFKKVADGHPLRLWKFCVDVEAPPDVVLDRIKDERQMWDEDLLKWRSIEMLDDQTEIYQYTRNSMAPHPSRDFAVLRSWKTDLPKGSCALVSFSVEHPKADLLGGLRAVELASHYLIEPCGAGKSRITHITRVDLRGRTPEWYKKSFGYICVSLLGRIKDSFKQQNTEGPESTV